MQFGFPDIGRVMRLIERLTHFVRVKIRLDILIFSTSCTFFRTARRMIRNRLHPDALSSTLVVLPPMILELKTTKMKNTIGICQ
jgi:hypothetical protein